MLSLHDIYRIHKHNSVENIISKKCYQNFKLILGEKLFCCQFSSFVGYSLLHMRDITCAMV